MNVIMVIILYVFSSGGGVDSQITTVKMSSMDVCISQKSVLESSGRINSRWKVEKKLEVYCLRQ